MILEYLGLSVLNHINTVNRTMFFILLPLKLEAELSVASVVVGLGLCLRDCKRLGFLFLRLHRAAHFDCAQ